MEFCSGLRRRETEHAERREGFGLERGDSCGRSEQRWGTKLDSCSRKPFDDHHRSTTLRTTPETVRASGILIRLRFLCRAKQVKAERQESGTSPIGQETKIANAHETFGEQVPEEAAQEFIKRYG